MVRFFDGRSPFHSQVFFEPPEFPFIFGRLIFGSRWQFIAPSAMKTDDACRRAARLPRKHASITENPHILLGTDRLARRAARRIIFLQRLQLFALALRLGSDVLRTVLVFGLAIALQFVFFQRRRHFA